MNKQFLNINKAILAGCMASVIMLAACSPDTVTGGNPLTQADVDASFTATTTDGNHYTATAVTDSDIQYHTWLVHTPNPTDTETEVKGDAIKDFTFPTPGTYTLVHRAVGFAGGTNSVSQQTFEITTSVIGPNIIDSPNFETSSDWSVFNTSGTETVTWTFNSGSATANGGVANAWSGQGIYQAVQVEAGTYIIDMHVESPGASDQMWFQVFAGTTQPVNGSDYGSDPTVVLGLNTWAGCATSSFSGMLTAVGCVGTGSQVTFTTAGTIYFVIKTGTGSTNGVNHITVSDVSMRKLG
ncbi:hypothetical protein ACLI1A_08105 [Flavobacterium sp. RHBU_3]|uniref:hypothetical protein n=1 Tax=Flavobacterium sp. RHBU_3 TaxID=3391184 RepID=UPI003984EF80